MNEQQSRMEAAYRLAAAIEQQRSGTPLELADDELVAVTGTYDRVEDVFRLAGLPHRVVAPDELDMSALRPDGFLAVNCAASPLLPQAAALRQWVAEGGTLLTTDWAVDLAAACFPGVIRRLPDVQTGDEVVPVEVLDTGSPVTSGLFLDDEAPRWWLESSSYPFEVTEGVQVLVQSSEMEARYGSALVAVAFHWYRGMALHMISHFYLQRAELRTAKDAGGSIGFVKEALGDFAAETMAASPAMAAAIERTATGELKAAYTNYSIAAGMLRAKKAGPGTAGEKMAPPRTDHPITAEADLAATRSAGYAPGRWRKTA